MTVKVQAEDLAMRLQRRFAEMMVTLCRCQAKVEEEHGVDCPARHYAAASRIVALEMADLDEGQ